MFPYIRFIINIFIKRKVTEIRKNNLNIFHNMYQKNKTPINKGVLNVFE